MKALLPGAFPERAFSTGYALKDLNYALELAGEGGVEAAGAHTMRRVLEETVRCGAGDQYFPALLKVVDAAR